MSKKFNVNDIVQERKNELDGSPLFQVQNPPAPVQEEVSTPPLPERNQEGVHASIPSPRTSETPAQSTTPSVKHAFVRRTFDFYEEQISYLKQESLREQLEGKEGSMNAMVREAIDDWIKKRTSIQ
jgi:hypothetical protein